MQQQGTVHILRPLISMRFRLTEPKALALREGGMVAKIQQINPLSKHPAKLQTLQLKFCKEMGPHHFIVGNQYQLNFLNFSNVYSDTADIVSEWSLAFAEKITGLHIAHRLHKLFVFCSNHLYCYGYQEKYIQAPPIFYQKITLKYPVETIYLPKKDYLLVFCHTQLSVFEMYNPTGVFEFKLIINKQYRSEHKYTFVCIPEDNEYKFSLFFQNIGGLQDYQADNIEAVGSLREPKIMLQLYHIQIVFNSPKELIIKTIEKMLNIMIPMHFGFNIAIHLIHLKLDMFLMHVGTTTFIFRHNYIIDKLHFSSQKGNKFICPLSKSTLVYLNKQAYDIYYLELNEDYKPERLIAKCIDYIPVSNPPGSILLSIKQTPERMIFFFQSTKPNNLNELYCWIGISDCVTKQNKLKIMLPERFNFDLEEGEQEMVKTIGRNVEIACKIGFSKSQAYLQLWKRCTKASEKLNEQQRRALGKQELSNIQKQQRKEETRKLTKREYYKILIATEDYDMIREELQNKLKVHELRYSQLQFVLRNILDILKDKMHKECSIKIIKQYAMCHFFCCKMEMLWNVVQAQSKQILNDAEPSHRSMKPASIVTVSIQQYYELNNIELFSYFYELLQMFLVQKKPVKIKIRAFLNQFSLILRKQYHQILPKIISNHFCHLPQLFQQIPQILPIPKNEDSKYFGNGPWEQIDLDLTQKFLLLDRNLNVEIKQLIEQFKETHFFKAYQWNMHGIISQPVRILKEQLKIYRTEFVFTQLYACLYEERQKVLRKTNKNVKQIVNIEQHIEYIIKEVEKYQFFPARLKGKFKFYSNLYKHFKNFKQFQKDNKQAKKIIDFFSLSEDELFLLYFTKEREEKGIFLLKQIKPIYQLAAEEGFSIFLRNMQNFFKRKQSSWSDIKIILLKFNNEKQDFHQGNQAIFDVIIKSIMQKVRIGGSINNVQLQEVISYVQNIPILAEDNDLLHNLMAIRQMYIQEPLLKKLNLDMNLKQILERGEQVLYKMVEHGVKQHRILQMEDPDKVLLYSYMMLVEINEKRGKLYLEKHLSFPYKSLIIILMQQLSFIPKCSKLLTDDYLITQFKISMKVFENIMIYLYRQRLTRSPSYNDHKSYLQTMLEFIRLNSNKSKFIVLSEAFANIFTLKKFKIQYPFFQSYFPTTIEIHQLVNSLDKEEVKKVNYEQVYTVTIALKVLGQRVQNIKNHSWMLNGTATIKQDVKIKIKHQIYTIFFIKMHREGLIRQALKLAKLIVQMNLEQNTSNIILPVLLIESLQSQLLPKIHETALQLISYYFYDQMELLQIIQELINPNNSYSSSQVQMFILTKIELKKKSELIYNPSNQFFSQQFKKILNSMTVNDQLLKINPLMETIWKQISQRKEQFASKSIYCIMFRLLIHDPLALAQYVYQKHTGINVRSLRGLFTLLGFECIFNMFELLDVGRSIFKILMGKLYKRLGKPQKDFDDCEQYEKYSEQYIEENPKPTAQDLLGNSIRIMNEKCDDLFADPTIEQVWKIPRNIQIDVESQHLQEAKLEEIRFIINNPEAYLERKTQESYYLLQRLYPHYFKKSKKMEIALQSNDHLHNYKYPFNDDDLLYTNSKYDLKIPLLCYKPKHIVFDEVAERTEVYTQIQYEKAPIYLGNPDKSNNNDLSFQHSVNKPTGGQTEFEMLFQSVLKEKADKYNKNNIIHTNKSRMWLFKAVEEDQGTMVNLLFEKKCIQGGYTSMLKHAPYQAPNIVIHENPLSGNLDVSQILEDIQKQCIDEDNEQDHSLIVYRQI